MTSQVSSVSVGGGGREERAMVRPNHIAAEAHSKAAETLISGHVHQDILNHTCLIRSWHCLFRRRANNLSHFCGKSMVTAKKEHKTKQTAVQSAFK